MNDELKNMYSKDIAREIQGVIKVDDENYIKQELEEYVVTDEILKHMYSFFDSYLTGINGNTEKMGVWISGFFGSGKSHFLKIISYLLENRIVDGKPAVDYFDDKIKDPMLLADIKRAGSIPTDVILFNIDSKASLDTIDGKDKILSVFEKVFNEKMGLSTIPHVAELERFLIKEGKYDEFKKDFKEECGDDWEDARNDFYFRRDEIVNSYSRALNKSKEEAENWFDKAEERYDLSIEKFAERVRDYIKTKGNNQHVVFLVDEIGQYIGEDNNLMLNLQTIVEDLGIECGGKAWVIVTSQEAIDDVIKVMGNNFSKIQGRFDTKLSLSSSDIDEVIKKRLLDKKEDYKQELEMIYEKNEIVIRNLLQFSKDTSYQKLFEDKEDFADTYPFIPYQFRLLQNVFTDIRKHGYAGKHLSSGERSLLGAFQGTAEKYAESPIGTLVPFYAFYDTIDEFLEHQVKNVIATANDAVKAGKLEEIDVKVLKMLFMLKNIKEIPANIDNLATLYVSNINDDKINIKSEIKESLQRLEGQTLIQRNNDQYKFLTDEEQEINREIKQIIIDQNRITEYLSKMIYGYVYTDNKFTYKGRNFPLTKYVDNYKSTQEYEIGIKVIVTQVGRDDTNIVLQSGMDNKFVYVKLELSTLTYNDIEYLLQVDDYRRSKSGIMQSQQVRDILTAKQNEVSESEDRIRDNIKEVLNEAEIIISGDKQNIASKDAKTRINEALETLVNNIYTKFSYIKKNYSTQDIRELWSQNKQLVIANMDGFENEKALEEMKEYIEEKNEFSFPITIRSLLQDFSSAPYGYLDDDILYLLTKLVKQEVVSLIYGNEIQNITSEDTLNKILKREYYDRTVIKLRKKIDSKYINDLKSVARSSFNEINLSDDEDGMARDFKEILSNNISTLKDILGRYNNIKAYQYPGKEVLEEAIKLYSSITQIRDVAEVFTDVSNKKEQFDEIYPKVETIKEFFGGSQKEHFDKMRDEMIIYDANKDYIDHSKELNDLIEEILSIMKDKEPYNVIQKLPVLRDKLIDSLFKMYEVKSAPIIEMANKDIEYIQNEVNKAGLTLDEFGNSYVNNCKGIIDSLQSSHELKDIYAQETRLGQLKNEFIMALDRKKLEMSKPKNDGNDEQEEHIDVKPRKIVSTEMLMNRSYEINSKEDIDKYIEELKEKLLKELEENNNLTIR